MQFVLLIYQGTTPALSQAEQQQIYKDYAELNQTPRRYARPATGTAHRGPGDPGSRRRNRSQKRASPKRGRCRLLAARIPTARLGGVVEVRPAEKFW
jgi:hypothetical protein